MASRVVFIAGALLSGVQATRPERKAHHSASMLETQGKTVKAVTGAARTKARNPTATVDFTDENAVDTDLEKRASDETLAAKERETALEGTEEDVLTEIESPASIPELNAYFFGTGVEGDEEGLITRTQQELRSSMLDKLDEAYGQEQNFQQNDVSGSPGPAPSLPPPGTGLTEEDKDAMGDQISIEFVEANVEKTFANSTGALMANVEEYIDSQSELLQELEDQAEVALETRSDLTEEMRQMTNSIRMRYCKAASEDEVEWNARPRHVWKGRAATSKMFSSFEDAWLACGETEWCGQVVRINADPSFDTKIGNASLPRDVHRKVDRYSSTFGKYFIASRSDKAAASETEPELSILNVSGCDHFEGEDGCVEPCKMADANRYGGADSDVFKTIIRKKHSFCGIVLVQAVDYSCKPLCPSSCMRMQDANDAWEVCNSCAGAGRSCSVCSRETFGNHRGCSGKCQADQIDCKDCPGTAYGPVIWSMDAVAVDAGA